MKSFRNVKFCSGGKLVSGDITFGTKIESVDSHADDAERIEIPTDCIVAPAFIDEHIHGAGGADVMDGEVSSLEIMANTLAKEGTARFLATTMTNSKANTLRALTAVKTYCDREKSDSAVLGVHLEGPFISPKRAGAQPEKYIVSPDTALADELREKCGGRVKLVTVAPECDGATELIRYLTGKGVICSAGHTDGTYADIVNAERVGLSCVTHTFNAQSAFTHREAGTVGAALMCDGLYCELIADCIHVSLPAIELLIKNKPKGKIVLITDAMRAKGCGNGESELGGQKVFVKNGEARLENGTLAGSVLKMNEAVANLVNKAHMPLCDAIDCATINVARNLGMDGFYGSIENGKSADFVVLSPSFDVVMTLRGGKTVHVA